MSSSTVAWNSLCYISEPFLKKFPVNLLQDHYVLYATTNINYPVHILEKVDTTVWEDIKVSRMHIMQKAGIF